MMKIRIVLAATFLLLGITQTWAQTTAFTYQGKLADLTPALSISAAVISTQLKLAMADSVILATARAYNATLWTQDEHFKNTSDVKYIAKP